jgi:hypothetical protein
MRYSLLLRRAPARLHDDQRDRHCFHKPYGIAMRRGTMDRRSKSGNGDFPATAI